MTLTIAIPRERAPEECRVAATPDTVRKLITMGFAVAVETEAGAAAAYPDSQYEAAGATIRPDFAQTVAGAAVVLCVQAPQEKDAAALGKDQVLIGLLSPYSNAELFATLAKAGVSSLAMELVPRTTRAQAMDVLSSQANLAGYRAVLEACAHFNRAMPMMMTAAGTIAPARVFIMGAGVAGLQAIATARRLGAIVSATDVRPAAKEQVQSLGASFVMVEDEETRQAETSGGYAKEMSDAYKQKQAALVAETIAKQDIVITTALIPGRPAPLLVTKEMVETMKPGSIVVDLAADQGGNCAATKPGKVVTHKGVTVIGYRNLVSRLATDASALYARNLLNLLSLIFDAKEKVLSLSTEDDIVRAILMTHGGEAVHPMLRKADTQAA